MSLTIKFLQGYNGDCILVSFDDSFGATKNILIDGGTGLTYSKKGISGDLKKEILKLIRKGEEIDLLVVTHLDDDHIGGILKMFEDKKLDKSIIKKVWFNSGKLIAEYFNSEEEYSERDIPLSIFKGLNTSVRQGVKLDDFLVSLGCWDYRIIKKGLIEKIDNCKITILSPENLGLEKLHNKWEIEQPKSLYTSSGKTDYHIPLEELIKSEDSFIEDQSVPNGSTIAFLFELDDRKLLLLGDAHPNIIINSLKDLGYSKKKKLKVDLVKISHHASKKNTSKELLELIKCEKFIISTNSLKHGLPDKLTLARIIKNTPSCSLIFNYDIVRKVFSDDDLNYGEFKAEYINHEKIVFE